MSARKLSLRARRTVTAVRGAGAARRRARGHRASRPARPPTPRTRSAGSPASPAARRRTLPRRRRGSRRRWPYVNKNNLAGRTIKVFYADDAATPDDCGRRLQPARQPDARLGDRRLRVDAVDRLRATRTCSRTTSRTSWHRPRRRARSASPNYFSLANVGQPAGEPARRLPDASNGTQEDLHRRERLLASGHVGRRPGARSRRRPTARRSSATSYEPLGTTDFSSDISKIAAAQPDTVIDILVGQRRDGLLQAVQDRSALERDQDRELPDGRRHRRGDRRAAAQGDDRLHRLLQGQPAARATSSSVDA